MFSMIALLLGCLPARPPVDTDGWYDAGQDLDVVEPIPFTDEPYSFGVTDGIGAFSADLFPVDGDTLFAEGESYEAGSDCASEETASLPREIEGVATILPRFYMKVDGCDRDDEKYYGSFFIEDASGGMFVLGDSKLAKFEAGNRVRIRARAIRTTFNFDMVYSFDLLSIDRAVTPIHYSVPVGPLGADDHSRVMRVSGLVAGDTDTFGAFQIEADDGTTYDIQIDQELSRRGVSYAQGTRIQVTGPVLFSYDIRSILIMSLGQVTVLGDE